MFFATAEREVERGDRGGKADREREEAREREGESVEEFPSYAGTPVMISQSHALALSLMPSPSYSLCLPSSLLPPLYLSLSFRHFRSSNILKT